MTSRSDGTNPRALGRNARALEVNHRAIGLNPRAVLHLSDAHVRRLGAAAKSAVAEALKIPCLIG